MVLKASALTRAVIALTVLGAAGGAIATPVLAGARHPAVRQVTCQTGGSYTRIHMSPAPMATFGSLQAGQSTTVTVHVLNGNICVAGVTVYVNMSSHVSGDTLAPQTPSQCGGTTQIGSGEVACTTDSTGNVLLVYTAPSSLPDAGTVEVNIQDQPSHPSLSDHGWYLYQMLYRFSASPIAHSGSLAANQQIAETLQVSGAGGNAEQNARVYLSFASTASSPGSASVGGTLLSASRTAFTTDSTGQIHIIYTAPASPPTTGIDTISAWSSTSTLPNISNATSYAFAATMPTVSIGDVAGVEGDGAGSSDPKGKGTYAEFTLTLSAPQSTPVTVQYITVCGIGDKTCQEDYLQTSLPKTRSVTIPANATNIQIFVTIYSYPAIESYPETYFVQLLNPGLAGAILGRSIGSGTIIQDDETTSAQILYVGDTGVVRGNSGTQFAEFTVTLALSPSSPVTFQYATADGAAVAGTDYSATSGTATIQPGSTSAHLQVPILPSTTPGSTLTFTMTIGNSNGPLIERAVGMGSILNWT
jgi:hypothetical protein